MRNPILILATVFAAGALSLGLWSWQQWAQTTAGVRSNKTLSATALPAPRPLPSVHLIDAEARQVTTATVSQQWSLWFFGFTHCPDVCPNTLGMLSALKQSLRKENADLDIDLVFVSVDPKRDTPTKLREYVSYFDPDMIGVTGDKQAIDALTAGLYLPYSLDAPDENGQYNVEHSGALVLVAPDATARAYFTAPHKITELKNDLRLLIQ